MRSVSRIENYRPGKDTVSFTVVSKSGTQRVEVVEGAIQGPRSR